MCACFTIDSELLNCFSVVVCGLKIWFQVLQYLAQALRFCGLCYRECHCCLNVIAVPQHLTVILSLHFQFHLCANFFQDSPVSISPFSSTINIKSARPVIKSPNKQLRMTVGSKVLHKHPVLWCFCFQRSILGSLRLWCCISLLFMGGCPVFSRGKSQPQCIAPSLGINRWI